MRLEVLHERDESIAQVFKKHTGVGPVANLRHEFVITLYTCFCGTTHTHTHTHNPPF